MVMFGCATSEPVAITKVNPYHLKSTSIVATDDRMLEFEHRRHLYGAIDRSDSSKKMGKYYSVFWKTSTRSPATVRFDYRQPGTGFQILTKEIEIVRPKRSNVTKFEILGDEYKDGGGVSQWRASVVESGTVVAEYASFLWKE